VFAIKRESEQYRFAVDFGKFDRQNDLALVQLRLERANLRDSDTLGLNLEEFFEVRNFEFDKINVLFSPVLFNEFRTILTVRPIIAAAIRISPNALKSLLDDGLEPGRVKSGHQSDGIGGALGKSDPKSPERAVDQGRRFTSPVNQIAVVKTAIYESVVVKLDVARKVSIFKIHDSFS
jgi:hypothetical protein